MKKKKKKAPKSKQILDCYGIQPEGLKPVYGKVTFSRKEIADWDGHW